MASRIVVCYKRSSYWLRARSLPIGGGSISGANQAIQDAWSLAARLYDFNNKIERMRESKAGEDSKDSEKVSLKKELGQYQNARFFPTASITVKAAIIGYLETGGRNGFYAKFRDTFFCFLHFVGVPKKVLLDSGVPKV
jgi:hypothetical protein